MNELEILAAQAPNLEFELADRTPVVKLGLIATIYFCGGYTSDSKKRAMQCFERFKKEYDHLLNGQFHKKFKKITDQSFEKTKEQILQSKPNEKYEWELSSAQSVSEAAKYSLAILNSQEVHGDSRRSFIKLTLPWETLRQPSGVHHYHQWLLYLCNQIQADHGYGGLSSALPYDHYNYEPIEYQLAQQHPGLEVDSLVINFALELVNSIKGANWYTILSTRFIDKLGGLDSITKALTKHTDIQIFSYDCGTIIRAGDYPELGSQQGDNPEAYVAVNRVIKPIRIAKPDQLHTYSAHGNTFDEESSTRWYARFDEAEEITRSPRRLAAGEHCSIAGFWYSPANNNVRQRFKQGEVMPEFKESSWGATFWYWSGEE